MPAPRRRPSLPIPRCRRAVGPARAHACLSQLTAAIWWSGVATVNSCRFCPSPFDEKSERGAMDTPTTLLTGIAMGESPRWHGDRLWFSDWGARQIVVVRHDAQREITDVPFELPFCIDWLHDEQIGRAHV